MGRCKQCNVIIRDDTNICPLCQCVIEQSKDGENIHGASAAGSGSSYPDIRMAVKKMKLVSNICLFSILLISAGLAVINYVSFDGSWWCLIPVASMAYAYLILRLVIVSRKGYRWKVFAPLVFALILMLIIDVETGFYRWSLNYVFPSGILLTDAIIIILMLTNLKNWQSYIVIQIIMIAVSLIPLLLWIAGLITSPAVSLVAFGVSMFLFLGALIIGDKTARGELKRRFHIQ